MNINIPNLDTTLYVEEPHNNFVHFHQIGKEYCTYPSFEEVLEDLINELTDFQPEWTLSGTGFQTHLHFEIQHPKTHDVHVIEVCIIEKTVKDVTAILKELVDYDF